LQDKAQVTLRDLTEIQPLRQGLAELVAYLQLGSERFATVVDETCEETISWQGLNAGGGLVVKHARLPRVIFMRD
jgi:hypothetical protein